MAPRIGVIIVSDYGSPDPKDWCDEIACAAAFLRQDLAEPADILVVAGQPPETLPPETPPPVLPDGARLARLPYRRSTQLRDAAVKLVQGQLIAVLEADCLPATDWLRCLVHWLDSHPQDQAVSGRTVYGAGGSVMRLRTLLDRGYVETGQAGSAGHVCTNGALYRRAFLERYPFPEEDNLFVAGWRRNQAILLAGEAIAVEPAALLRHAYEGPAFERDLRRNVGFRDARDWGRGSGLRSIFQVWRERTKLEWADLQRLGGQRLRWWDWLLVPPLVLSRRLAELPGIRAGLRPDGKLKKTGYR